MSTIEIIREDGQPDLVDFSFRYTRLTENEKNEIENELKNTIANIEVNFSSTNDYVVIFDLDKSVDPLRIKELNGRLKIDETKFGVWVSLTTCYDHSGLTFPDHVVSFIRSVGGQLDISIITITEDD